MENQRIRISKAMLKEALIQLLQQKPIEKISIYELCDQAQVNRTTFYKYYGNQYDLLKDIEQDIFSDLEQLLFTGSNSIENLNRALEYLISERRKCLVFMNATPDKQFAEKLFELPVIVTHFQKQMPDGVSDTQRAYMRLFFCHGAYAIIVKWLNDENREPVEEISQMIYAMASMVMGGEDNS